MFWAVVHSWSIYFTKYLLLTLALFCYLFILIQTGSVSSSWVQICCVKLDQILLIARIYFNLREQPGK